MASKVLKSFLIGIGWDTSKLEAGDQKIMSSIDRVKSSTLGVSAAIIGAFGAVAASVNSTANRVDQLALRTQNLRTGTNAIYGFGNAVRLMGGDASEAVDALTRFEEIQNNLRLKGDAGPIRDLAMAGIDTRALYATQTGDEFLRALADMIPSLDEGQRSLTQNALGLSDATFRAIAGGFDQLSQSMDRANELTGNIDQLTENSRKLKDTSAVLGLTIEGITNELAEKFMPSLVEFGDWANDWISEHRGDISGVINTAAENPEATALLGASSAAAISGSLLSRLGLQSLGGAVTKSGQIGITVAGSALGARAVSDALGANVPGYSDASRSFDQWLMGVTGLERIPSPLEVLFGGNSASETMAPESGLTAEETQRAGAAALAEELRKAPINLNNSVTIQLDGQALESKITQVNDRHNYEALGELQTTTER